MNDPRDNAFAQPPAVPRRAVFDDLRVGQWVAYVDEDGAVAGRLSQVDGVFQLRNMEVTGAAFTRGEVTILRDAPASPVTVRREYIDRLDRALEDGDNREIQRFARALIDNADTGDTS